MSRNSIVWFAVLTVFIFAIMMTPAVYGYETEEGGVAEMVKLERVVTSTTSMVGRVETITYNLTGDTIVFDPPKEIALVVDISGSMDWTISGGGTRKESEKRITMLKNAAKDFVKEWKGNNCKICIVPFSNCVKAAPKLINMKDSNCLTRLDSIIDGLVPEGNTNIGDGMRVAYHTLNDSGNSNATKYVITLTDGEPNTYTYTSKLKTYYESKQIVPKGSTSIITDIAKGRAYCTTVIGDMIFRNSSFRSFVIGFATPASLVSNLNKIGMCSGANQLANGNYFYNASSETELKQVYEDIGIIIANDVPFTSAMFSELLPEGTVPEPAAVEALEAEGFAITMDKDPDNPGGQRVRLSRSLSGMIFLTRKYPDATTSPENCIYQLSPYSFSITVVYTTPGIKVYKDTDAKIVYKDPFIGGEDTEYCNTSESVSVIQPVSGISSTHAIVMPRQNEDPPAIRAEVLPNTPPNIAYNRKIGSWRMVRAEDVEGVPVSTGSLASLSNPPVPDTLNACRLVQGLAAGKVYAEALSEGTNLDGEQLKGSSVIYIVDGGVSDKYMNSGDQVDLNDLTVKYIPNTNTGEIDASYMSFGNWRLKNPADATYLTISPEGIAKAVKPLVNDITVMTDVDYTVGSAGAPAYISLTKTVEFNILVAKPVTGVVIPEIVVMAGGNCETTATVLPHDAFDKDIEAWRLIDENGNDVTGSSPVARLTAISGQGNTKTKVTGKRWGKVYITAESAGNNADGFHETGSSTIFVTDAQCTESLSVDLWDSGKIEVRSFIPAGLTGSIQFTWQSDNPSSVFVSSTGEVRGLQPVDAAAPVAVRIKARYMDGEGNYTGQEKDMVCLVSVIKPKIDVN